MLHSPKVRKFLIFLSVLLAFLSFIDLSFYLFRSEVDWPALKSSITLMVSILMYLLITKPELFKH